MESNNLPPAEPWAKRNQLHVDENDEYLLAKARTNHMLCAWWWGRRKMETEHGAYCYICDGMIATFDSKWPIPQRVKNEVQKHKLEHLSYHLEID